MTLLNHFISLVRKVCCPSSILKVAKSKVGSRNQISNRQGKCNFVCSTSYMIIEPRRKKQNHFLFIWRLFCLVHFLFLRFRKKKTKIFIARFEYRTGTRSATDRQSFTLSDRTSEDGRALQGENINVDLLFDSSKYWLKHKLDIDQIWAF